MEKVIGKLLVFVAFFAASWFLAYQVDWMNLFGVKENSQKLESKLGSLYWEMIEESSDVIKEDSIITKLDSILIKICEANNIDRDRIKLHLISTSEVNAFTLPDDHMIINTGLILSAESAEELAGVVCHELAHMTENHVMEKLMKEIGLNVLISSTTGGGGEIIRESASVLTSTAFDRDMEREADERAVDFLIEAEINPEGFAEFMYRLSQDENEIIQSLSFLSTHPLSEDRAIRITEYSNEYEYSKNALMTEEEWEEFQNVVHRFEIY